MLFFIATSLGATDCESYNPSSMITSCDEVDICCDENECWYQLIDSGNRTDDPDVVLDEICAFASVSTSVPYISGPFFGPWTELQPTSY